MTPTARTAARRFLGTVAAAAAAIGLMTAAAAVPARASDGQDLARALAAIAVIGIIAKSLDDKKDQGRPAPVQGRPGHGGPGWGHPGHGGHPGHRAAVLPAACAIEIDGPGRRSTTVYSARCLQDRVRARLPGQCQQQIRQRGRTATVYGERCLIDAGFRPERGRR